MRKLDIHDIAGLVKFAIHRDLTPLASALRRRCVSIAPLQRAVLLVLVKPRPVGPA